MAGIGFELRKLYRESGLFSSLQAYAYSSIVTVGPMICCMVMIIGLQQLLERFGVSYAERELFLGAVVYAFVFSILLTNGILLMLTRFVSDKLYLKQYTYILSAWYGAMIVCLSAGGLIGAVFLYVSPVAWSVKLTAYLLYMELIIIWSQSLFISALQEYMKIVKAFTIGAVVCLLLAYFLIEVMEIRLAVSMLIALDVGFFATGSLLMVQLERTFWVEKRASVFAFLSYVRKFPSLFWIGLFTSFGLYIHQFIYWFASPYGITVEGTFRIAPFYDTAVFYAFITIIPSMVIFVVSMETQFYAKFKEYYQTILTGGSINDILRARKEMIAVMLQEVGFLMGVQLIFSVIGIAAGIKFLPRIGFTAEQLETYNILVCGFFVYIVGTLLQLMLLYFDDRKGVLMLVGAFVLLNTVLNIWLLPVNNHGLAFFIASFLMVIGSLARLIYILRNINYYTFSAQPIYVEKPRPLTLDSMKRLLRRKQKRTSMTIRGEEN